MDKESERTGVMNATPPSEAWTEDAQGLHRTFTFADFKTAVGFVVELARHADRVDHHPDIDIRYNTVKLNLLTHDAGDVVTEKDRAFASWVDGFAHASVQFRAEHVFQPAWEL
jgi:4a-hydroxytetrahydrobiopterin dehydratase